MKKLIFFIGVLFVSFALLGQGTSVQAQGMMGGVRTNQTESPLPNSTTAQDEADGKAVYDKLQAKQVTCAELTDDDFDVLGDYYMGQRLGSTVSHDSMNTTMTNMMGADGEKQMHISLGKRLSGCDVNATLPANGAGFLSMMGANDLSQRGSGTYGMMGGFGNQTQMHGWNSGFLFFHMLLAALVIVFLVLGIIYFWKEITQKKK
ncbi:MAG: hypothetical protein ABI758_05605 [Candidatus Woesebacteria bacterium]